MTSTRRKTGVAAMSAAVALALGLSAMTGVNASSHREAPLIAEDPVADNTDVYAFLDADEPGMVNLIANWIPLEEPASGPNFHAFGDDVLYTINVDIDDNAIEDVTYEFRFRTLTRRPATYLYNDASASAASGNPDRDDDNIAIDSPEDDDWNRPQLYTVTEVRDGVRTELATDLFTPPVNVGPRSTPNYAAIASQAVYDLPDGKKVFAGQRDEAFSVDLGSIFDLAGLRPLNQVHAIELPEEPGVDTTSGYNVHSIAMQVPIAELSGGDDDSVIGVWSDTYRRKTRVFLGNDGAKLQHSGPWVQVSRLGMPLVNEVVIPLQDKDNFNASDPVDDGQFLSYVNTPLIDDQIWALYHALSDDNPFSCYPDQNIQLANNRADDAEERPDLVAIFLTGIEGVNQPVEGTPYEALRLNLSDAPPAPFFDAGTTHFPNGRHPEDDVVDTALQAVAGAFGECQGESPNDALGDGVSVQQGEAPIDAGFPFLPTPHQGYEHTHDHAN